MPCYHPIQAWRDRHGVTFKLTPDAAPFKVSCGRCIGCKLERSRVWATRIVHENREHELSSFITLTYSDECLPSNGSLCLRDFQLFMKKLRRATKSPIRFFHAGEYGEKKGRPHYHAIIFGEDFRCRKCRLDSSVPHSCETYDFETSDRGDTTWSSTFLDGLWEKGRALVGAVTFESAAYVARYITKKITGPESERAYKRVLDSGKVVRIAPEYATMSRRPGIGHSYFASYADQIYRHDFVVIRGVPSRVPKFYDKLLEKADPSLYARVKDDRECALSIFPPEDRTPDRLAVRERVKQAQLRHLSRRYEIE